MVKRNEKYAIIVAGGAGVRMGGEIPKQFLPIGGLPVLMHTLNKFKAHDAAIHLILVLPESQFKYWEDLCEKHAFNVSHRLVEGGSSRFNSVKNGLNSIAEENGLVAIHDGVRPFVSEEVIQESFAEADLYGSAIAVVPLKDSIRKVDTNGISQFKNRDAFRLVQTPQTFQLKKIKAAFLSDEEPFFTDDATVYENMGWEVHLIAGNQENIKLTTPEDLDYANYLLNRK
ncbi:2-C-methyl-D-erythritol 4-phosphate cytidylyltransferase [Cyclobacterium qasimii]|uniref:2-C-methyl-D-erythritol 4-phosphate cytidylyltransferase n=2 Tax=Cyclobacterium qasimii TaxID=1350429 RepID=S7VA28_9BACT|nr:2-C-methyl-D-erythritol 4-phosphate cytidylyltransferase [Cyclobacterium qasimii]EPR66781.1 2-C-methyl-D-erythritol 4-phosphate cytidylyltransferase [Cyclobacterium qasimii M12-11B]GEO21671.1 2-C-methyl-D-erythritol 4-phosphate cytidylyltransferase [Cyclobacterium qasimii]